MNTVPRAKETEFKGSAVTLNKTEFIKGEGLKPEEYIIEISENGNACITYSDNAGRLYAEQTMKQLSSDGKRVPLCRIRDYPSFYYRGYMLDCARHMFTVDEIKKLADAMALLKFNKFHWHLTDDQGWRIESERYPMLNSVSAVRKFSSFGKKKDNSAYGRVYTKAEIKEVIEYCGEREIEVIPEFDIPGHTSALLAAFPELSCGKSEIEVKTHQGIFEDVICLSNEKSLEVILNIFDEICELFPSKYIHIGGDETPKAQWEACPECRNEMAKLGINDYKEYQNSFTNKVIEHLECKGKTCIVWNDAAEGKNLDRRAIVQYWKEKSAPSAEFANSGGRLILSPFTYYYTDYEKYEIPPEALADEQFAAIIAEAEKYLGFPYVWGGSSPATSFDCSGFVSYVYNNCGLHWNFGRLGAEGLRSMSAYVSPASARPGDLIFFEKTYDTSGASHVGIYVGNNMMIHCGDPIQYTSIDTSYWRSHFLQFGRLP